MKFATSAPPASDTTVAITSPSDGKPLPLDDYKKKANLTGESINFANPVEQQQAAAQQLAIREELTKSMTPQTKIGDAINSPEGLTGQLQIAPPSMTAKTPVQGAVEDDLAGAVGPPLVASDFLLTDGTSTSKTAQESVTATRIASLDIDLPERGVDYFFKSPRGNVTVTARSMPQPIISRWISVVVVAGLCVAFLFVWRIGCRLAKFRFGKWLGVILLALSGLYSLGGGTLPIYGAIALAAATALIIESIVRKICSSSSSNVTSLES